MAFPTRSNGYETTLREWQPRASIPSAKILSRLIRTITPRELKEFWWKISFRSILPLTEIDVIWSLDGYFFAIHNLTEEFHSFVKIYTPRLVSQDRTRKSRISSQFNEHLGDCQIKIADKDLSTICSGNFPEFWIAKRASCPSRYSKGKGNLLNTGPRVKIRKNGDDTTGVK